MKDPSAQAVFDIGKTNKKFLLFNDQFDELYQSSCKLEQISDDDGFPCEDMHRLKLWMFETLDRAINESGYTINKLNFSTYGATLVFLDRDGQMVLPPYDYQKPIPPDLMEQFLAMYNPDGNLAVETASPVSGMLNSGLQLYYLKHQRPALFNRVHLSLHLPQYFLYLFTGRQVTESTSIGCHTALWDYQKQDYHDWVYSEGFNDFFPKLVPSATTFNVAYKGHSLEVGVGLHDSSASLIPFLRGIDGKFLLISTGTWSITLNPFCTEDLTPGLLDLDCLNYMTYEGRTIRASRLFLGHEHQCQVESMLAYFNISQEAYKTFKYDASLVQVFDKESDNIDYMASLKNNTGLLCKYDWSMFHSAEEAYHKLMIDLVDLQVYSIKLAQGSDDIEQVMVTGGFCDNKFFLNLLARKLPGYRIYVSSIKQSSATGAAMAILSADDHQSLYRFTGNLIN